MADQRVAHNPPTTESSSMTPFGSRTGSARLVRLAIIGVVLTGAVFLTIRLARQASVPSVPPTRAATPNDSTPQQVMLDEPAARRIGVSYAAVLRGTLSAEVRTVAQVTYDETRVRTISPRIDGWVEQLFVNATGQPVTRGQPLLSVYSPMLVSAQEELLLAGRLGLSVARADSGTQRGASDLRAAARRRLQYWDIPDAQIDELERTGEVTRTMTLRSPASGVIVQKNVLAGQRIMAGDALYQVADLSVVWIEGEVFERDLASVRAGQWVGAEFDALPGETRRGRITQVYPVLNPDTRTARVRVELTNSGLQLKPGMYATLRIAGTTTRPELLVPRGAVLSTGERHLVFVKHPDGTLQSRVVTIGISTDEQTQVLTGLALGDTVVRSATFLIDAESNLGAGHSGMGPMPGMDMGPPASAGDGRQPAATGRRLARPPGPTPPKDMTRHED